MDMSIATGATLNAKNFKEFIERLKYSHSEDGCCATSHPVFQVREKRKVWGFDGDYDPDGSAYYIDNIYYHTEQELINSIAEDHDLSNEQKQELLNLDSWDFLDAVKVYEPDCFLVYCNIIEKVINTHLTREAAEAFIKRKQHDHQELFVYVESAYWCWEFQEVVKALLDGRITYKEPDK